MFRRYQRCSCMNNSNNCNSNQEEIETSCDNSCSCNMMSFNNSCECGFDEQYDSVFPDNPMLAQSYVPIQYMDKTFKPNIGLKMGTIFPELVSSYEPCQSMREIEYIEAMNSVGEGCNQCQ